MAIDNRLGIIISLYNNNPRVQDNEISDPSCLIEMDPTQLVLLVRRVFDEVHFTPIFEESGTTVVISSDYESVYSEVKTIKSGVCIINKDAAKDLSIEKDWISVNLNKDRKTALYGLNIITTHINSFNLFDERNSIVYYMMFNRLEDVKPGKMFLGYLFNCLEKIAEGIKKGDDVSRLVKCMNGDYMRMVQIQNNMISILNDLNSKLNEARNRSTPLSINEETPFINEHLALMNWIEEKGKNAWDKSDERICSFVFNYNKYYIEAAELLIYHTAKLVDVYSAGKLQIEWRKEPGGYKYEHFPTKLFMLNRDFEEYNKSAGVEADRWMEKYIRDLNIAHKAFAC